MLRCIALASASAIAIVSGAHGADIYTAPASGGYKDGPTYVAVDWAGAYIGAHVGGATVSDKVTDLDGYGFFNSLTNEKSGVFGGGQLGYNFQRGNIVFGVEGDIGAFDTTHTVTERLPANLSDDLYADVTGRLGYSFDKALVYAKGGVAFFDGTADVINSGRAYTAAKEFTGWTLGGGLEYKIAPSWSLKAEYLHFDFGSENSIIDGCCKGVGLYPFRYEHQLTANSVKVGVNYFVLPGYAALK